jgi:hypothetical protein
MNGFVGKLIVSNSNPEIRLCDYIKANDGRLILIDESKPTRPGYRFVLANEHPADYFLSVDDDIFLSPAQWAVFFDKLLADKAVPHGLVGNIYKAGIASSNGSPFHHVTEKKVEVDVLIGAYAFTQRHTERLFLLGKHLGIDDLTNLCNGEDVLLSFAGLGRPKIHDLGSLFCCTSTSLEGVALWRTLDGFWDERVRLFERARAARQQIGE